MEDQQITYLDAEELLTEYDYILNHCFTLVHEAENLSQNLTTTERSYVVKTIHTLTISLHQLSRAIDIEKQLLEEHTYEWIINHVPQSFSGIEMTLRMLLAQAAMLRTCPNWQSPTYDGPLMHQAGYEKGRIERNINDYKRDVHEDGKAYEKAFVSEYVVSKWKPFVRAYLTSSGQSAFTTALFYLQNEKQLWSNVYIGKNIYFQNKELLAAMHVDALQWVDEAKTAELMQLIADDKQPITFVLDTITNAPGMTQSPVSTLISRSLKRKNPITFLVDATTLPLKHTLLQALPLYHPLITVLIHESLNKYHQFGLDRVTAGILYGRGHSITNIFSIRKNAGTIITDYAAQSLIPPNHNLLCKRLTRFARNTSYISAMLHEHRLTHAYMAAYESHYDTNPVFKGSHIHLLPESKTLKRFTSLERALLHACQKEGIPLFGGTSFGFTFPRIYTVGSKSEHVTPFMRLSVGAMPLGITINFSKILTRTLNSFT